MDNTYKSRKIRVFLIYILISIIFILLLIKMFSVANINITFDSKVSNKFRKKIEFKGIDSSDRVKITDRNGLIIATTVKTYSIYVNPKLIKNPEKLAKQLCQNIKGLNYDIIIKKLSNKNLSFVWIKKNITPSEKEKIFNMGIPGVLFEDSNARIYPLKNLFSHIIGYVNVDGKGMSGFEFFIDNDLPSNNDYIDSENNSIRTSLDVRLQDILYNELLSAINKYKADGGAGIILDVETGEVLSILSLPDFDPNHFSSYNDIAKFNKASLGVYEIGSIMKIFTLVAAIDAGTVKINDIFNVSKPYKLDKFMVNDLHKGKDFLTTTEIFMKSSNIGMARIADTIDPIQQFEFFKKLNLFSPLEIEIPEKGNPIYPKNWSKITSVSSSYGYGIAISFVHLAQSIASIINGGYKVSATILPKENSSNVNAYENHEEALIKKETYEDIKMLMYETVRIGTGKRAKIIGYDIAGKTGTAMKNNGKVYDKKKNITSFVAVFPANSPKYLIIAMLDEPKVCNGIITGGTTVVPLVKLVIEKSLLILGVEPSNKNFLKFD